MRLPLISFPLVCRRAFATRNCQCSRPRRRVAQAEGRGGEGRPGGRGRVWTGVSSREGPAGRSVCFDVRLSQSPRMESQIKARARRARGCTSPAPRPRQKVWGESARVRVRVRNFALSGRTQRCSNDRLHCSLRRTHTIHSKSTHHHSVANTGPLCPVPSRVCQSDEFPDQLENVRFPAPPLIRTGRGFEVGTGLTRSRWMPSAGHVDNTKRRGQAPAFHSWPNKPLIYNRAGGVS